MQKPGRSRHLGLWLFIGLLLLAITAVWVPLSIAQDSVSQIIVTGSDASSAPAVRLHVLAVDGQGNPVMLDPSSFVVLHNGTEVEDVSLASPYEAGTFAIFLIDIPQGVAASIPILQEAIMQYASEPTMKEQVDAVAIFSVDELAAVQILEPVGFQNSVQNAFATPLTPKSGPTALIDSTVGLLNNLEALKPRPEMATHIVLMSDGTDIVSTQFEPADVPRRAAELGIPIHTVFLDNQSLSAPDKEAGRQYLSQIATGTRALSTTLATIDDLRPIWDQIATFREQMTIQYTADDVAGGDYSVEVSLRNNPAVFDDTTVTFPAGAPSIVIELPPESRSLTLANLDQPVPLSFSTTLSWLDGVDRKIEKAQLLVNGIVVQDIDPGDVDRFDVELANLRLGANQVQIAVVDDQGGRATSPEITLDISQGEVSEIPEEVAPRGLAGRIWNRISGFAIVIGGCFLILFLIVLILGISVAGRNNPLIQRLGLPNMLRRVPFLRTYFQDVYSVERQVSGAKRTQQQARRYSSDVSGQRSTSKKGGQPSAFLEVLESTSTMPSRIDLDEVEVRLGRSSNQANIVFKNDGTVSRLHSTIAQEGSEYRLYDEQSTSGTWVNEQRVPEYGIQLVDGDEIRLGAVRLRFRQP